MLFGDVNHIFRVESRPIFFRGALLFRILREAGKKQRLLQAPLSKLLRDTPNPSAALKPAVYKGLRGSRCDTQTLQCLYYEGKHSTMNPTMCFPS